MNKFKLLSLFTSALCFYLFYLLLFSPQSFLADLGVEGSEAAYFVSRRAAMLMLGISILTFFIRSLPHSQARQAIALSICITMSGLALAGSYELLRGFVGQDILTAIVIETILAASFLYIWFANRRLAG